MQIIGLTQKFNFLIALLFLSRIKLAEIQFEANKRRIEVSEIVKKVKRHVKISKVSYFLAIGYLLTFSIGYVYYKVEVNLPMMIQVFQVVWIVIIYFLTIPILLYYSIMIEKFIKIISVNYQIRKWRIRLVLYTTFTCIVTVYAISGVTQVWSRFDPELQKSCAVQMVNFVNWFAS